MGIRLPTKLLAVMLFVLAVLALGFSILWMAGRVSEFLLPEPSPADDPKFQTPPPREPPPEEPPRVDAGALGGEISFLWSPDPGEAQTSAIHVTGSGEACPLAGGVIGRTSAFALSPDGRKVAFVSGDMTLNVVDADGSNLVVLTDPKTETLHTSDPTWSPDGRKIAYSSVWNDSYGIHIVNADGTGRRSVTEADKAAYYDPDFSPNGGTIAFTKATTVTAESPEMTSDVYVVDLNDGGQERLTGGPHNEEDPDFSPDGEEIVFSGDHWSSWDIYSMKADGSNPRRLTTDPAPEYEPSFSPDGTRLLYEERGGQDADLFQVDATGKGVRNVTNNPGGDEVHPKWVP